MQEPDLGSLDGAVDLQMGTDSAEVREHLPELVARASEHSRVD